MASAVGDAVEAVVDTVVEGAESVADASQDVVNNVTDGARDWIGMNTNPILAGLANVGLGLLRGVSDFFFDTVKGALLIIADAGSLVANVFRLNFAGVAGDFLNILMHAGEIVVGGFRFGFGGYFMGSIKENFERDRSIAFIKQLLEDEFSEKQAETLLKHLGYGTTRFGLRVNVQYSVLRMDSNSYPLAADHNQGFFDLYALAGLLSFRSFNVFRERTRVVKIDDNGSDMWYLPTNRWDITSFLETGSPRLRVYAWEPHAVSRAMRFARTKFRKLCIILDFGGIEYFSRYQSLPVIDIFSTNEYLMHDNNLDDNRYYELGRFLATRTSQDGELVDDAEPLATGCFKFTTPKLSGIAAGIRIRRGSPDCSATSTADACITETRRKESDYGIDSTDPRGTGNPDTPCGRGVLHRDTYPPYFSQFVLAHELGHHYGLAHIGHDGFHNIMYADENNLWDWNAIRWFYQGGPDFQPEDTEHAWRFLVRRLPHVL